MTKNIGTIERFMEKVSVGGPDECWPFLSSIGKSGCGRFYYHGKCRDAYRVGYELMVGPIPDGTELHHVCRNRLCVNPSHLQAVSRRDHLTLLSPGHLAYINSRKTHCPNGHPYTPENMVPSATGRVCLTCARKRIRECQARRRAREQRKPPT